MLNEGSESSVEVLDHNPVIMSIPSLESAFPEQLEDSPYGKGFNEFFVNKLDYVLSSGEPDIERLGYDEKEYESAMKIWNAARAAGIDNEELVQNIAAAKGEAGDLGYTS